MEKLDRYGARLLRIDVAIWCVVFGGTLIGAYVIARPENGFLTLLIGGPIFLLLFFGISLMLCFVVTILICSARRSESHELSHKRAAVYALGLHALIPLSPLLYAVAKRFLVS